MAGELKVETRIGSAVDPSVGQAFSQTEQQVRQFEGFAQRIGEALRQINQAASPLAEHNGANDTVAVPGSIWLLAIGDISKYLSEVPPKLDDLIKATVGLGKTMETLHSDSANGGLADQTPGGIISSASKSASKVVDRTIANFAQYEAKVEKLVANGQKDANLRPADTKAIEVLANDIYEETGMSLLDAVGLLTRMFESGMDLPTIKDQGLQAARVVAGQQMGSAVASDLFWALNTGKVDQADLSAVLNTVIGQAGQGSLGLESSAKALSQLLPQVGSGGKDDVIRLSAIIQTESSKGGSFYEVLNRAKASFLEYRRNGSTVEPGSEAYGEKLVPSPGVRPADHISIDLAKRRETLASQLETRESSEERLSIVTGDALSPVVSGWTEWMTLATDALSDVVDTFSGAVTVLGGVALGGFGLVKGLGAIGKAKLVVDATKALANPAGAEPAGKGGIWSRIKLTAGRLMGAVPDVEGPPRPPAAGGFLRRLVESRYFKPLGVAGALLPAGFKAVDTMENATTFKEKAQGYGEAIGMAIGGVGGTLGGAAAGLALGPAGALAGSITFGALGHLVGGGLGKLIGGVIGDLWGDDSEDVTEGTPQASGSPSGAGAKTPGQPSGLGLELWLLKHLLGVGGNASMPEAGASVLEIGGPGDAISLTREGLGALRSEPSLLAHPVANAPGGEVVRSVLGETPAETVLPEKGSASALAIASAAPQHFAVTPNIDINVQGILTDPLELVRVLQPEIQRMFTGLAAQANTSGQLFDRMDETHGYV